MAAVNTTTCNSCQTMLLVDLAPGAEQLPYRIKCTTLPVDSSDHATYHLLCTFSQPTTCNMARTRRLHNALKQSPYGSSSSSRCACSDHILRSYPVQQSCGSCAWTRLICMPHVEPRSSAAASNLLISSRPRCEAAGKTPKQCTGHPKDHLA